MNGPIELLAEEDKELLQRELVAATMMEFSDTLYYKKPGSPIKFFIKPVTGDKWIEVNEDNIDWDDYPEVKIQCEASLVEHSENGLIFNNQFNTVELDISTTFGVDGTPGFTNNSEFGLFMRSFDFVLTEWPLEEAQEYFNKLEIQRNKNFYAGIEANQERFQKGVSPIVNTQSSIKYGGEKYDTNPSSWIDYNDAWEIKLTELNDPDVTSNCSRYH